VVTSTVTPKRLGYVVQIASLTEDGRAEVIAGGPESMVNGEVGAGVVSIWLGRTGGLNNSGHEYWHQDRADVPGAAEGGDWFGRVLSVGNVLGNFRNDVIVGVPLEAIGTRTRAGAVTVLPGSTTPTGVTGTGSRTLDQNTSDVPGTAEANDRFGSSLQVLRDGGFFLLVGASGEQVSQAGGPGSGSATWFGLDPQDGTMFTAGSFDGSDLFLTDENDEVVVTVERLGLTGPQI
jgi:hypothetical protein